MSEWALVLWFSLGMLFYIYLGYPLLALILGALFHRKIKKGPFVGEVSVVIAVTPADIEELIPKVESVFSAEESGFISEVLIGVDGGEERHRTDIVQSIGREEVKVSIFPERRGKTAVLNDLVAEAAGDLLFFTDARQKLDNRCLSRLLHNFADPAVGVVSAELVFWSDDPNAVASGMGGYWAYEKMIRKAESRFGSVPGATGAGYMMRRDLFQPVPPQLVLDDVAIPVQGVVRSGRRCILEEGAWIFDRPSDRPSQESRRKIRTIAGNIQLVSAYPGWLNPFRNPVWFQFISHKLLRLISPILLVTLLTASFMLMKNPVFLIFSAVQTAFYLVGITGLVFKPRGRLRIIFGLPMMFLLLNIFTARGWIVFLSGKLDAAWARAYVNEAR